MLDTNVNQKNNWEASTGGYRFLHMGEGAKLSALLTRHGIKQAQFATAAGVSRQMVHTYTLQSRFKPEAWERIRETLEKLGIDPSEIRPVLKTAFLPTGEAAEDLRPLIQQFNPQQLERLLKILESHPGAISSLRLVILDRLERVR